MRKAQNGVAWRQKKRLCWTKGNSNKLNRSASIINDKDLSKWDVGREVITCANSNSFMFCQKTRARFPKTTLIQAYFNRVKEWFSKWGAFFKFSLPPQVLWLCQQNLYVIIIEQKRIKKCINKSLVTWHHVKCKFWRNWANCKEG